MTYTAGPWQVVLGTSTGKKIITFAAVSKSRHNVAHVGGPDREANANLISAAPELLHSLNWLREILTHGSTHDARDIQDGLDAADASIAKATQQPMGDS